jgi:hypothetical protein
MVMMRPSSNLVSLGPAGGCLRRVGSVEIVGKEEDSNQDLRLFRRLHDALRQGCLGKEMVKGSRHKGCQHGLSESLALDGIKPLVEGQEGASTASDGSAENGTKDSNLKVRGSNRLARSCRQLDHDGSAHAFVHKHDENLKEGRQRQDLAKKRHIVMQEETDENGNRVGIRREGDRDGVDKERHQLCKKRRGL